MGTPSQDLHSGQGLRTPGDLAPQGLLLPRGPQSPALNTEMEGELSPLAEDPPRVKFKVEWRRAHLTTLECFGGAGGLVTQLCLSLAPWTVALQAPLSMGFSRQEY